MKRDYTLEDLNKEYEKKNWRKRGDLMMWACIVLIVILYLFNGCGL